ncbi:MAG: sorbosone dehydrogenase family protein [Gammaproteobacteria bacterium]|nr:sorbosone dehydrogenase family protein [Gammaproteobacteria bacterium]
MPRLLLVLLAALLLALSFLAIGSCAGNADLSVADGTGPEPALPAPKKSLLPLVHVAKAQRWDDDQMPLAAEGLEVAPFAAGLDHPRWLYVLPNGDVLVAETNAQQKKPKSLFDRVQKAVMKRAGAGVRSADRITLLRDSDGDGIAEKRSVFLSGLTSPFGMALIKDRLYVANTDGIVSFPYSTGALELPADATPLAVLPAGELNNHWTKSLIANADGKFLYAGVGSNSDHGENGMHNEQGRAAIWEIETDTGESRLFATGLRNPVGMDFEPVTGQLWTAVNERDDLGGDLVPDYMTSVTDGGFYGWPYSYYGDNLDPRIEEQRPDLVASAIVPDYALGPHTASLGLCFAKGAKLGAKWQSGAFVGQHGSWNRKPRSGYKVIYVPFTDGEPDGSPIDVLTGFLDEDGKALGRPVGVAIDSAGALLVADDVGNTVWRVTRKAD